MKFKIIHVAIEVITKASSRYIQVVIYDNSLRRSIRFNIFVHTRKDNKISIAILQAGIQKCEVLYQTIKSCLYTTSDFINVYRNSRVVMGFERFP